MSKDNGSKPEKISRIVIEFEGSGLAAARGPLLENVTLGQALLASKMLELHVEQLYMQVQIQMAAQKPNIVVPKGPMSPP